MKTMRYFWFIFSITLLSACNNNDDAESAQPISNESPTTAEEETSNNSGEGEQGTDESRNESTDNNNDDSDSSTNDDVNEPESNQNDEEDNDSEAPDDSQVQNTPISAISFVDAAAKTCVESLAVTNNWTNAEDFTHIECESPDLENFDEIAFFINVTQLNLNNTLLSNLALKQHPLLTQLSINQSNLTSIDVSGAKNLTRIDLESNQLTALDISSQAALTLLVLNDNQLPSLDISQNSQLQQIHVANNLLTALSFDLTPEVKIIDANDNQLTQLSLVNNTKIQNVQLANNNVTRIELPNEKEDLAVLLATGNPLNDVTNIALQELVTDGVEVSSDALTANDIDRFSRSLYATVNQYCVGCHNDGNANRSSFADNDINIAFNAINNDNLIQKVEANIPMSAIVLKVQGGHQCWSGDCNADAQVLINGIEQWLGFAEIPVSVTQRACVNPISETIPSLNNLNIQLVKGDFKGAEGILWKASENRLYFSEINRIRQNNEPASSIIKLEPNTGNTEVWIADSNSNGLALSPDGLSIVNAANYEGVIRQYLIADKSTSIISSQQIDNTPFAAPNDLTIRSDGHLYFTDPTYGTRLSPVPTITPVIWVKPNGEATVIDDTLNQPNGISLSPNEQVLYVTNRQDNSVYAYDILPDGSASNKRRFTTLQAGRGADGMTLDCAGNLYVTQRGGVSVYNTAGTFLGEIPIKTLDHMTTNVAFGGSEGKTLFITVEDRRNVPNAEKEFEVYQVNLNIPGLPY